MAGNNILTIGGITREAIRLWKNSNAFLEHIDRQFDKDYAVSDAKIGENLRIRLPSDYTVRTGQSVSVNTTNQVSTTLVLGTQQGVDLSFSSATLKLSLQDFSKLYLAPAINNLAGAVATAAMQMAESVPNIVTGNISSGAVSTPGISEWAQAGAVLSLMSAPGGGRRGVLDLITQARTIASFSGLFNPTGRISKQYDSGEVQGPALGVESWMGDQTCIIHTTATYTAQPTVNGAGQSGNTLTVNATTGAAYNVGDIITIAGVNAVNRITKVSTGQLAQFVVTAAYAGGTTLEVYPPITPPSGSNAVQYQTVDASPASGAQISCVTASGVQYRKNVIFRPEAFTMATAALEVPAHGIVEGAAEEFDSMSMRMIRFYDGTDDQWITRLDVLYGLLAVRPEWACIVADVV